MDFLVRRLGLGKMPCRETQSEPSRGHFFFACPPCPPLFDGDDVVDEDDDNFDSVDSDLDADDGDDLVMMMTVIKQYCKHFASLLTNVVETRTLLFSGVNRGILNRARGIRRCVLV